MRDLISNVGTDYAAFACTGLIVLVFTLIYLWWNERSAANLSFPGLKSKDENLGNLGMITREGGLHKFLLQHHKKFGSIFSFYWGKELVVSLGAPQLFKDVQTLFDRPINQFLLFKPLIGDGSIQYMNSPHGKKHRQIHDRHFSFTAINGYLPTFIKIGKELIKKWHSVAKEEQIPLRQHMMAVALKSIVRTSFGEDYMTSNKEILQIEKDYDLCWSELEMQLNGDIPEPNGQRWKTFEEAKKRIQNAVYAIIKHRRSIPNRSRSTFLDVLLEEGSLYPNEEKMIDMGVTYLVGGFHTTGNLLTWIVYYIATHAEVEKKLRTELDEVLPPNEELTMNHVERLTGAYFGTTNKINVANLVDFMSRYLKKVVDEGMRCSTLAPFAARYSDYDIIVGGHVIPKQTPMITALGVVLQDEKIWPEPQKFDPERFSEDNVKSRHPLAFQPFGFAGKRKCPGYRFAYYEAYVFLSAIYRNFEVELVEGQKVEMIHGLVTTPKEEIWVKVQSKA